MERHTAWEAIEAGEWMGCDMIDFCLEMDQSWKVRLRKAHERFLKSEE